MKKKEVWFKKSSLLNPLIAFYFFIAFIEFIAEYNKDQFYISITKPVLIPILIGIYLVSSKIRNLYYIVALFLVWIANLYLISNEISCIVMGTVFFLFYRIIILYLIMNKIKFPGALLMFLCSLPFLIFFIIDAIFIFNELGYNFYLFLIQGVFMVFFGGLSLANHLAKYNKSSAFLLTSTVLITFSQLLFVINVFYVNYKIIQPLTMVLFIIGQYYLYLSILLDEKKQKRYKIIN